MRKESLGVFIIIALIVSLTFTSVSVTSSTSPVVSLDPQTPTVNTGATFEMNVTVANVTDSPYLYGWQFNVTWNSTILRCTSVSEGTFLKDAWNVTQSLGPDIKNSSAFAGSSIIADGQGNFPEYGANGSGTLATVTFEALSEGQTNLTFVETKLNTWNHTWDLPEEIVHTSENGTVTVTSAHDVAVVSVVAPTEAASPSLVPINVTVKNEGSFIEEANVTIYYNMNYIDSENVTLVSGNSTTIPFSWNTTGLTPGPYTINATATIPLDDDPTDNWKTKPINLVEHDVAVTDVDAPTWARIGTNVTIDVTVENQGAYTENLNITVSYDDTYIDSENVTLVSGNSTTIPFSWNTTGLTPGPYTINATATIPADDDLADNWKTKPINLVEHDVAVTDVDAPTWARIGTNVTIDVTVENQGAYTENLNITVSYDDTYIGSENVTLVSGNSTTIPFSWNTTGLTPGPYTINATATIPADDDLADNWKTKPIELKLLHDVAVISLEAPDYADLGDIVSVNVTVKNEGDFLEEANVTIRYHGVYIDSENVTLNVGANQTISFNWNTTGLTPGPYTISATATIPADDDLADNYNSTVTILQVHDVAVTSVVPAKNQTYPSWIPPLNITVTVFNNGSFIETVNVTLKYDTTLIGNKTVALVTGQSYNVSFSWNLTDVAWGLYNLTARVTIPNDTNPDNDEFVVYDAVKVKIPGDALTDDVVDYKDLGLLGASYNSVPGHPRWNPDCDFNCDYYVDYKDLGLLGANYGQTA